MRVRAGCASLGGRGVLGGQALEELLLRIDELDLVGSGAGVRTHLATRTAVAGGGKGQAENLSRSPQAPRPTSMPTHPPPSRGMSRVQGAARLRLVHL